ncbi:MAG: phosphate ABC transporter permease family protein, partial [Desulfobulbaceae bacterium]|nr:phosphate ABC transporter permease family protein [Desulfobulbaceae bacterium]
MSPFSFLVILLAASSFAYMHGKRRAFSLTGSGSGSSRLHSRPGYYGMLTALWCALPALAIFVFWMSCSEWVLTDLAMKTLPASMLNVPVDQAHLLVNDLHNLIAGHV